MLVKFDRGLTHWLGVIVVTLILISIQSEVSWIKSYPETLIAPFSGWLNSSMAWFIERFGWIFLGMATFLEWPIKGMQWVLHALPWIATVFLFCLVSYIASGWKLAVFTLISALYIVVLGYWDESMNSLSLVAISVPMAIFIGFGFGVWGFFSDRAERFIMPTLDILQTVPAFAYLLPILMLFGFGTTVGLIASLLYSFPPMVRNTIVGLRGVSPEIVESGLMSGATPYQLFWQVRVPTASRQILLGVNQATMASLSMVIIASIIGGTADIGWEVLSTIRKAQFGESVLAGIVIALMAMIMDRITSGLAVQSGEYSSEEKTFASRYRYWLIAGIGTLIFYSLAKIVPVLNEWPRDMQVSPAGMMNDGLTYIIINFREEIESIKKFSFFFVMLPVKIGLQNAVSPFTWGFELKLIHSIGYAVVMISCALWCAKQWNNQIGIVVLLFAIFFFFGLTNMPWPAILLIYTVVAWKVGGFSLAYGTLIGLSFLVVTGVWPQAMLSLYLCSIAVIIAFVFGTIIGIWAAHSDRVSAVVRPINDTMQTMPLFVILIPFVMLFKIGDFTALLAIIAYAFVPAIRYSEHGLRNLPEGVIDAATMAGCTKSQLLWQVKIPLALPVMMLGLNQTIMYGIAMLVIAALVGTNGLGQTVYIGLSDGDFGVGIIAGIGMAIIAIIADRMTQAWSRKRQAELGFSV